MNININFTDFPVLETERITLRALNQEDVKAIFGLRTNKSVNTFIKRDVLKNLSEARAFIDTTSNLVIENKGIFWVLQSKNNNELMGTIGLRNFEVAENYAEIGYDMHPNFQERGFMSEAFQKVLEFASQEMNLKTIEAFTHKNNNASAALLKKYNFKLQLERKEEDFEDNIIYKLIVSEHENSPTLKL